jgi:DHA1 family multidrug resistance protein-like MFS transporter
VERLLSVPGLARGEERMPLSRGQFAILLAAALAASMAYGVTLPLLPALVESAGVVETTSIANHTGWLTATFTLGLFLLSPVWGALSDRGDARAVIATGLAGGGAAVWALGFPEGLVGLYISRAIAGALTAAVLPAVFAYVTRSTTTDRPQRFAWIATATSLGFLLGPVVGNILGDMTAAMARPPMAASAFAMVGYLSFACAAGMIAVPRLPRKSNTTIVDGRADERRLRHCLLQTAIVVVAITVAEVGLTLLARGAGVVRPDHIAFYFGVCSAAMVGMQLWAYPRLERRFGEPRTVAMALVSLAVGVALLTVPRAAWMIALAFVLGGSGVGVLIPALAVRVAQAAGPRPGWGLGRQAAAANLGQAAGAALTGTLYAVFPPLPFAAAALAAAAALVAERYAASWVSEP